MKVNVLYEQGLENIAGELEEMGFSVHPLKSGVRADAVLYVSDVRGALHAHASLRGASILCVRAMSAGEIAGAIRRRSVSALF